MGFRFLTSRQARHRQIGEDVFAALRKSQAIIEFEPDGTVISANDNFLAVLGYALDEIVGRHHSLFVDPAYAASAEYRDFWDRLRAGAFQADTFRRLGRDGREVWIEAAYNPLLGPDGKVYRVVKTATDVTDKQARAADARGQLEAIDRSQATIEFALDGTVLHANANFCRAMGYALDEIRGRHHRLFVDPEQTSEAEYEAFWQALRQGQFQAAEYLRLGKGGRRVWIQATYNPILDAAGRPCKVVKYATDITGRKAAVDALGNALQVLASGDLRCRIEERFPDELDGVRHAFNDTVGRFSGMIGDLRRTSGALRSATAEILTGANDLAERTTRQTSAIEETSAAVEQLTRAVEENAESAGHARTNAVSVAAGAAEAGAVMDEANRAMERIALQSAKISNIIGLIDDIAFQTNLLALNASVEAARAGDAGKGFAVVAVEVRRLAQSAANASSEVKGLIEQSGEAVTAGGRLVSTVAEKLTAMAARIEENSGLMEGIAQASREQAASLSEVRTAIRQMDEMTQHNAALVEETNAAIEQTEGQAVSLDRLVELFRVDRPPRRDDAPAPAALRAAS